MSERRAPAKRPRNPVTVRTEQDILNHATQLFLWDGYGATTVEKVAKAAGIRKQAIYARWEGKPYLFLAVLEHLSASWSARTDPSPPPGLSPEAALSRVAGQLLAIALLPDALALHRVLVQEMTEAPELSGLVRDAGVGLEAEVARVATILNRLITAQRLRPIDDPALAAEQFLHLVVAGPRARALGLGETLDEAARRRWVDQAVTLFLCCYAP